MHQSIRCPGLTPIDPLAMLESESNSADRNCHSIANIDTTWHTSSGTTQKSSSTSFGWQLTLLLEPRIMILSDALIFFASCSPIADGQPIHQHSSLTPT
eukprot:475280-Rhodomonas_salina.1